MLQINKLLLASVLLLLLFLTACLPSTSAEVPTPAISTPVIVVPTSAAVVTIAATVEASPTATVPATEPAVIPTATTASHQTAATPIAAACTDAATFVADVTIPDNTHYLPESLFTKTWRVKNIGTCTWDKSYAIAFKNGDRIGAAYDAYALTGTIAPGASVDISIKMQTPQTAGTYQGNWELRNAKGTRFGVGQNNTPLWVKIIVDPLQASSNGAISGVAWRDLNFNNVMDSNESLVGVGVTLASGANCHVIVANTVTDGNGRFNFPKLPVGSYCLSGNDGSATISQSNITLGTNQTINDANIFFPTAARQGGITGYVYQDKNQNGLYDTGDVPLANRDIWLQAGGCDQGGTRLTTAVSQDNGRYAFHEVNPGTYCVGLKGTNGMEDVWTVTVTSGQLLDNVNLKAAPFASIAGWFWIDHCHATTDTNGTTTITGNCVADPNGGYHANGIPDAGEVGLSGVTILIQLGPCGTDNPSLLVSTTTDSNGQYMFPELNGGTYCIQMNAAQGTNATLLLPGDWTYPAKGIWYSQVTIYPGEQRTGVNFGWDYQFS